MFVIINIKPSGKKRVKKGRTVDKVHEFSTKDNERFYIVDVLDSAVGVNWDEVSLFLGNHRKTVLFDRQFDLPRNAPVQRFEPTEFRQLLLFNTASLIFKELYLSGIRIKCCVNDTAAECPHLLEKIVKYSAQIVVVTSNKFRYLAETEFLYDYYGAGITVANHAEVSEDTIILDSDNSFNYSGKGILFSSNGAGFSPLAVDGRSSLSSLCPEYIDKIDFLAAVHKFNRCGELSDAVLSAFMYNGTPVSVGGAANRIKNHLWKKTESEKSTIFYV